MAVTINTGTTDDLNIGYSSISGGSEWEGDINFVYIYDRALSASEILTLHEDPYQIFEPVIPLPVLFGVSAPPATTMAGIYYRTLLQGMR